MTSHLDLPIFISSTNYNLIDLRGELKDFLNKIGYRAILSSDEGFHDRSPDLHPWESCLPVVDDCPVVIVVIDGRYGTPLKWPHYKEVMGERQLSPTHGEFIYARAKKKRLMVFIRASLIADYERYRQAKKLEKDDKRVKAKLYLPGFVDFETLKFVEDVKTGEPICWFRSFNDVTDIKREVQHQLLNELALAFRRVQTQVVGSLHLLAMGIESLPPNQKAKLLESIGVPEPTIADLRSRATEIQTLKEEIRKARAKRKKKQTPREELNALESRVETLMDENVRQLVSTVLDVSFVVGSKTAHERTRKLLDSIGLSNPFVVPTREDLADE